MPIDLDTIQQFKRNLQQAVIVCSDRCLLNATKWAAELLDGINAELLQDQANFTQDPRNASIVSLHATDYEASLPPLSEMEYNKYLYAKALFQAREFDHVNFVLQHQKAPKLRFLRLYARYMAGEKRKEEKGQEILGITEKKGAQNMELDIIYEDLRPDYEDNQLDAFCLYLYGIVLRRRDKPLAAATALLRSIKIYEYNWSAWMELSALVKDRKMFHDLQNVLQQELPHSLVKNICLARLASDLLEPKTVYKGLMDPLIRYFSKSAYLKSQWAAYLNSAMLYNESEIEFDAIRRLNPYRLEDMDVFSNILYIINARQKLSVLARKAEQIDKYRPETCCIIANYYTMKCEYSKSVPYFKRALKLNRNYHLAWTLLGHDYIELKNPKAAIECYERATEISERDYRAWYGLGQAYEVLKLPYYAAYYFQKAAHLRPHDERMWNALAACYAALGRKVESEACFGRVQKCREEKAKVTKEETKDYLHASFFPPPDSTDAIQEDQTGQGTSSQVK
ncbi:anaphase promoting complex subunit 8 [Radiomyces spectabilis]|uniref:anaphase promoting complex subunit 8 n=1 Tax=Radiomyces spectabilis TaxID=64574 RepID=UPI00221ECC0A|nr:anaphase promoting complex subunit 8 [Radiomyces spectabilis]KAI8366073.1 anaphase promoting complex subunit 8 [Radiomyces spectabilis]